MSKSEKIENQAKKEKREILNVAKKNSNAYL